MHDSFTMEEPLARQVTKPTTFIVALTLTAGIASLLAGYETAVTASALVSIRASLSNRALTSIDKSMITSSTSLLAFFASPIASRLADRIGRKSVLLGASLLFSFGSFIQATASTVPFAILGRSILGAAVGASSTTVPMYIVEIAPPMYRGMLVTATILLVTVGQILGFTMASVCAALFTATSSWRWTVAFAIFPALVQACLIFCFMPDTPRWLVMVGRPAAARRVLRKLHRHDKDSLQQSEALLETIQRDVTAFQEAKQTQVLQGKRGEWRCMGPWRVLLSEARYRRALAISCMLVGLQQFCGFNALMYYSTTIFVSLHFRNPSTASLLVAFTNFVFTLISLGIIDRVGRRRILLLTLPLMILALLAASLAFAYLPVLPDDAPAFILISVIFYVAAFALGLGNVPAMQSELYPSSVRALGSGVATGVSWMGNFVVGLTFLPLMDGSSLSWTLRGFSGVCAVGLVAVWAMYPETAGLTLEEAGSILERGWAVR